VSKGIEGLDRLMKRFDAMPANVRKRAGQQAFLGAEEMVAGMKAIAPRDDGKDGDEKLVDHIYSEEGRLGDVSYVVISDAKDSKGRPKAPRVELGHLAPDGSQVPAEPHFYPVVRTVGPKVRRRIASAVTRELRKK
jgi:hypothetical protein